MGWDNVFHCEWNPFGQRVLKHYWPKAISYEDITKTDFTKHYGTIDIISGGSPCQPYSLAGKRKGKEDERHLWPQMLRAIREVQPRWIVGENVLGLVNWSGGLVFHEVQADLEAAGYEVFPYVLPACGKDAPHRRDRVWFVAHTIHGGPQDRRTESHSILYEQSQGWNSDSDHKPEAKKSDSVYGANRDDTHANGAGLQTQRAEQQAAGIEQYGELGGNAAYTNGRQCPEWVNKGQQAHRKEDGAGLDDRLAGFGYDGSGWGQFPTQLPLCGRNDGIPTGLDGTSFSAAKWRNESIKAFGNAIVPQVVYEIFKAIEKYENMLNSDQDAQECDATKA
jgi:DNA (cytosine-5)-methyltransferase 1